MEPAVNWKGIWKDRGQGSLIRGCGCILGSFCAVGTCSYLVLSTANAQSFEIEQASIETEQVSTSQGPASTEPNNASLSAPLVITASTNINTHDRSSTPQLEEFDSFTPNIANTSQQSVNVNSDPTLSPSTQSASSKQEISSTQYSSKLDTSSTQKELDSSKVSHAQTTIIAAKKSDAAEDIRTSENPNLTEAPKAQGDQQSTEATNAANSLNKSAISCRHRDCLSEVEFSLDEIKSLQQAANKGDASAQNVMGLLSLQGKYMRPSPYKAAAYFVKAAAQNYAEAQNNLGELYLSGHGVDQDYTTAFQWFDKSAAQGLPQAEYNLGRLYMSGMGVNQNYDKAWQLFNQAAEQGHVLAQFNVGKMYLEGIGVKANKKQAGYWFSKSCQQNFSQACRILDKLGMEVGNF